MIYAALIFLIIGALCLLSEIFIPGFGFFGITGIISLIVSSVITVLFVPFGVFIVLAEILALGLILIIVLKYIKRHQLHGKIILDETLNDDKKEIAGLDYFIGKSGVTKTPLRPFGSADFNGNTVDVYSEGEYISEHESIKVVAVRENKIYVKKLNEN